MTSASNILDVDRVNVERLLKKVTLRLLPFLLVLYVISYLDRINLSFAALEMNSDLHLSKEAYGFGGGIFFFGYCAFAVPSNIVIERLGPRRWISLIMIAWGLVTLCMCQVHNDSGFYALRLVLGVAESGFFPGMLLYLTRWYPPDKYGTAVARFMTAIPVAGVLGSFMAAPALSLTGLMGLAGWKWLFIITGLPAVLFGVLAFFVLVDKPSQAKWLSAEEGSLIEKLTASKATAAPKELPAGGEKLSAWKMFLATVKDLQVWHFGLLYFSMSSCMYGFQLWLPQIVQTFGNTSAAQTALLSAIPAVFQGLGMQIIAGSSDRRNERRWHLVASAAITCCGLMSACLLNHAWLKLAGLSFAAFGIWGTLGPFWALARGRLKAEVQPTAIALINSIGGLGGFVGPYLVGRVSTLVPSLMGGDASFASALVLLASSAVLTATLALLSRPRD